MVLIGGVSRRLRVETRAGSRNRDFFLRPGGSKLPGLTVLSLSAFIIGAPALAGVAELPGGRGIEACIPEETDFVAVHPTDQPDIFRDDAGQAYYLADIVPEDAVSQTGRLDRAGEVFRAYAAGPVNRWRMIPAWVVDETAGSSGLVQGRVLRRGRAIAAPAFGSPDCAALLKAQESVARKARRGLWHEQKVLKPEPTDALLNRAGQYVVAEGRIVSLGKTRSTRYLNFGFRWKRDFTVTLKASDEAAFDAGLGGARLKIADLEKATVRVRGVVQIQDGPLIELKHPGQLDIVKLQKGKE